MTTGSQIWAPKFYFLVLYYILFIGVGYSSDDPTWGSLENDGDNIRLSVNVPLTYKCYSLTSIFVNGINAYLAYSLLNFMSLMLCVHKYSL
jgi:hypothetical protein